MAPGNLKTGHVGLNVTGLKRSLDFYVRVFDFEVMGEDTRERAVEFAVERVVDTPSAGLPSPGAPKYSRFNPPVTPAIPAGARE